MLQEFKIFFIIESDSRRVTMAYFLGNKKYGKLKPLVLLDENDEKIPDKLLDILRFTTRFSSENDLKDYLLKKNLIDNFSVELCYLISKGNKDNRYYEIIKLGDHVYLSNTSKFLSVAYIKQYINEHRCFEDFIDRLHSFYYKKYGLFNMAVKTFINTSYEYSKMIDLIEKMLGLNFSEYFKKHLRKIMGFLNDPKTKDEHDNMYLNEREEDFYQDLLSATSYEVSQDDGDVRRFVTFFKGKCNYPTISVIRNLEKMSNISNYIESVGTSSIQSYDVEENICTCIEKLISSIIYIYNPVTKDYKKVNGTYKINERNLCDLVMFLATNDEYNQIYENSNSYISNTIVQIKQNYPLEENDDDKEEEFLEESDFERLNMNSEEYGYNLRYGDGINKR